ncbi:hypothetical protein BC828DRAFT_412470 [Blastocladiella britannica]|nr:hypothetical protein BC828DRAFT_412470 [Blastocladiella britannica]
MDSSLPFPPPPLASSRSASPVAATAGTNATPSSLLDAFGPISAGAAADPALTHNPWPSVSPPLPSPAHQSQQQQSPFHVPTAFASSARPALAPLNLVPWPASTLHSAPGTGVGAAAGATASSDWYDDETSADATGAAAGTVPHSTSDYLAASEPTTLAMGGATAGNSSSIHMGDHHHADDDDDMYSDQYDDTSDESEAELAHLDLHGDPLHRSSRRNGKRSSRVSTITSANAWDGRGRGYWRDTSAPPLTPLRAGFGHAGQLEPFGGPNGGAVGTVDLKLPRTSSSSTRRVGADGFGVPASTGTKGGRGSKRGGFRFSAAHADNDEGESVPMVPVFPKLKHHLVSSPTESALGRWLRWLGRVEYEKYGKRRFLIALAFYLFNGWLNVVACNVADFRRSQLPLHRIPFDSTLPDIGHDYLPDLSLLNKPIPDYFIVTLTGMTTLMLLFHKHRLGLLRRYLISHGVLLIFRSITIISTTVPDPQLRCATREPAHTIFRQVNPFFPDTCGDMIFSGHTVVLTMVGFAWHQYGPQYASVRRGIWAASLLGMVALVAARYHYTVDVLLSFGLTALVWLGYGVATQSPDVMRHSRILGFLERRSSAELVTKWTRSAKRQWRKRTSAFAPAARHHMHVARPGSSTGTTAAAAAAASAGQDHHGHHGHHHHHAASTDPASHDSVVVVGHVAGRMGGGDTARVVARSAGPQVGADVTLPPHSSAPTSSSLASHQPIEIALASSSIPTSAAAAVAASSVVAGASAAGWLLPAPATLGGAKLD